MNDLSISICHEPNMLECKTFGIVSYIDHYHTFVIVTQVPSYVAGAGQGKPRGADCGLIQMKDTSDAECGELPNARDNATRALTLARAHANKRVKIFSRLAPLQQLACHTSASSACGSFVDVRTSYMRFSNECMTREMRTLS
jgi:hypothetical protein